jgi:hypothetical protein
MYSIKRFTETKTVKQRNMKQLFLALLLGSLWHLPFAQTATLSGHIRDAESGEALTGATCYVPVIQKGVTSNAYGFYSITLPEGKHQISFSFIGYETQIVEINLEENQIFDVFMVEETMQLGDVVVMAERRDRNITGTEMSMERVSVKMVEKLPSFMGETDVLKTITLLPGIQSGGEGSSGLYVRGGGPDQNLLILDEAPVYNASHLLGFFSVFNSDAIKDIDVYKGGIPAEYGGKASSVIDIRMKEGNSKHFSGQAGIGNISSR